MTTAPAQSKRRGENTYRLRYRIDSKRFEKTFTARKPDARKELRRLLKSGDDGDHIEPNKLTVGQWIDQWVADWRAWPAAEKGSERTVERYSQLSSNARQADARRPAVQQLKPVEIDKLYSALKRGEDSATNATPRPYRFQRAALPLLNGRDARRANPMVRLSTVPNPDGQISDDDDVWKTRNTATD